MSGPAQWMLDLGTPLARKVSPEVQGRGSRLFGQPVDEPVYRGSVEVML
jgi:hypothetical protein